jgi:enamine deaminase RidA (YjgF/YER057c/UK114 family)
MLLKKQSAAERTGTQKVDHETWIDHSFTFFATLPDLRNQSEAPLFDPVIADIHQFGDAPSIGSVRAEIEMGKLRAPETALLSRAGAPGGGQMRMISGVECTPLLSEGRVIGNYFEDANAKYCILGDIRPRNIEGSRGAQTGDVLRRIQRTLMTVGMDFRHVVRTWFYNDRILDWYGEFNKARASFFERQEFDVIPASTGIGTANAAGTALIAKAIAVMPKNSLVTIRSVESPLQCEASAYGSVFSRAFEVADPAARVLYVSGTASIAPNGDTEHVGNAAKQIEKTMEVVDAMLAGNGMSVSDTVRAIGYFRRREHIPLWRHYCRSRGLEAMPILLTECEICRDDLLFEIELDAAREAQGL